MKKGKKKKIKAKAKVKKGEIKVSSKLGKTPYSIGASVGSTIQVSDKQYLKLGINCNVPIGCKEKDKEAVENSALQMLVSIWKKLSKCVEENGMEMSSPEESESSEPTGEGESKDKDPLEAATGEVKSKKTGKGEEEFLDI